VLAAGSDGSDGSAGAAGAFADGTTVARALTHGLDPAKALARHDTRRLFATLGDLFVTGPTGTNVGDWVFLLRS
jgi:hydroxypyruvate reductase